MISGNQVAHQGWLVAMAGTMTTGVSLIAWCAAQVANRAVNRLLAYTCMHCMSTTWAASGWIFLATPPWTRFPTWPVS
jgi:hypothetical protein